MMRKIGSNFVWAMILGSVFSLPMGRMGYADPNLLASIQREDNLLRNANRKQDQIHQVLGEDKRRLVALTQQTTQAVKQAGITAAQQEMAAVYCQLKNGNQSLNADFDPTTHGLIGIGKLFPNVQADQDWKIWVYKNPQNMSEFDFSLMGDNGVIKQGSIADLEKDVGVSVNCDLPGSGNVESVGQIANAVATATNPQNVENTVKGIVQMNAAAGEDQLHQAAQQNSHAAN